MKELKLKEISPENSIGSENGSIRTESCVEVASFKGINTSQIMISIQIAIREVVGKIGDIERASLIQDFTSVTRRRFDDSNNLLGHPYSKFIFKDYAPKAFQHFRKLFGIKSDAFLQSMCSQSLRQLTNPGSSGSLLYLSHDDEFILKTVDYKECRVLLEVLPAYFETLTHFPKTLLPKFFGLYKLRCSSRIVRLVLMSNILPTGIEIHQKYDLKGSTHRRMASPEERQKSSPTLKDLDFLSDHSEGLRLDSDTRAALIKTLHRDTGILEMFRIMDYSILLGIHNLDLAARSSTFKEGRNSYQASEERRRRRLVAHSTTLESIEMDSIDAFNELPYGGLPGYNSNGDRLIIFVGLIDILQNYRLTKKLEHTFKATIHDGDSVSVHRPGFYAQRFMKFLSTRVFIDENSAIIPSNIENDLDNKSECCFPFTSWKKKPK